MRVLLALFFLGCSASTPKSTATAASAPATAAPAATAPATAAAPTPAAYPPARRGDVVETHHGVQVADPYRWLEEMDSAETRAWLASENAATDTYLRAIRGRDALHARIAELVRHEWFGPPWRRGRRYFWRHHDGVQGQPVVLTATSPAAAGATALDPNAFSSDGSLAFAGTATSEDGARLAYGLSIGGGDWQIWHIRDVASGKDLADELGHIKYYAPVFTRDGNGLYYSRFPAPAPGSELTETDHDCKVYFHKIGTKASDDVVVYQRPDHPTWQYDLARTRDGRYLVITIGDGQVGDRGLEQVVYLDLAKPRAKPVPLIDTYNAEYLFVGNDGPRFLFQTNNAAANKRIIAIDIRTPAPSRWKSVVAEGPNAIDSAQLAGRRLFVTTMKDAHHVVTAYDLGGKLVGEVALPGLGTVTGFKGGLDDKETFYAFTSFTAPDSVYRYDFATGTSTPWKTPRAAFDSAAFETRQIFFPAKDGTKVPMFVTGKKGFALDGRRPTIITAYGFAGIPYLPAFDPTIIAWLERGGLYVVVNIRGGGEYGEAWHNAAKLLHRQVAFDDFIAAGEWLIANKYTAAAHLGSTGVSGGGMLVGAVLMQRPDLYGASVPIAGVLDLLRFHLFGQGAGWSGDLGSPDNAAEFAMLQRISPLHNVRAGTSYPPTLIITSDHDVRVAPLHSYKLAAAMQAAQSGPARVLLLVRTQTGHGGGSTTSQEIDQQTEVLSFFAHNLGLPLQ